MDQSASDRESPEIDEPTSIEPWLQPVLFAGLLGGAADCLGAALLYNVYLRAHSAAHPPLWGSRPIPALQSFFAARLFVFGVCWAALFAVVAATQQPVRDRLQSIAGSVLVTTLFGTVMWIVMRSVVDRGNLEEPMLSIIGWLTYVLFAAPAIVWTLRRALARGPVRGTTP